MVHPPLEKGHLKETGRHPPRVPSQRENLIPINNICNSSLSSVFPINPFSVFNGLYRSNESNPTLHVINTRALMPTTQRTDNATGWDRDWARSTSSQLFAPNASLVCQAPNIHSLGLLLACIHLLRDC